MYSSVHGIYLVMLMKNLGNNYIVLDRSATVRFLKPGKGTLFTQFELSDFELNEVRELVEQNGKTDRQYLIELKDKNGVVCGDVMSTIHIRKNDYKKTDHAN